MTTPELPPLTTYDHECVDDYGDFRSKMVEDNLGEWVRVIEVEARERILRDRIAELETVCAGHYANTVESLRLANEADARAAELEADAERYRHLLDNCYAHAPPAPKEKVYLVSTVNAADWRTATGAAIDAARGKK